MKNYALFMVNPPGDLPGDKPKTIQADAFAAAEGILAFYLVPDPTKPQENKVVFATQVTNVRFFFEY